MKDGRTIIDEHSQRPLFPNKIRKSTQAVSAYVLRVKLHNLTYTNYNILYSAYQGREKGVKRTFIN